MTPTGRGRPVDCRGAAGRSPSATCRTTCVARWRVFCARCNPPSACDGNGDLAELLRGARRAGVPMLLPMQGCRRSRPPRAALRCAAAAGGCRLRPHAAQSESDRARIGQCMRIDRRGRQPEVRPGDGRGAGRATCAAAEWGAAPAWLFASTRDARSGFCSTRWRASSSARGRSGPAAGASASAALRRGGAARRGQGLTCLRRSQGQWRAQMPPQALLLGDTMARWRCITPLPTWP